MVDIQLLPDGCCIVRFSGEDAKLLTTPYVDTPENRSRSFALMRAFCASLDNLDERSAYEQLDKQAHHIYNLFFRYWNPERQPLVIEHLKECIVMHDIEVYCDLQTGAEHVNIRLHKGQSRLVRLLLENMNATVWRKVSDPKVFVQLYHELAAHLEYRRGKITAKSMRNTLSRAIKAVQEAKAQEKKS